MQRQNAQQPWMNHVDVASLDARSKRRPSSAKVALPKLPIPGVGALAAILDPEENIRGRWEQTAPQSGNFPSNGGV